MKRLGLEHGYQPLPKSREHLLKYQPKLEELPPRTMQDSFTSAIIPLSTNLVLQDKYVTYLGNVRMGRLLEDMDMFAGWHTLPYKNLTGYSQLSYLLQPGAVTNMWSYPIFRQMCHCLTPLSLFWWTALISPIRLLPAPPIFVCPGMFRGWAPVPWRLLCGWSRCKTAAIRN